MHRVVFNPGGGGGRGGGGGGGRGGRGGGAAAETTGTFTAKLTVNGKSYTQTFNIRPDPRFVMPKHNLRAHRHHKKR